MACRAHNLLTAASMNYKRASHLARALDPETDTDQGTLPERVKIRVISSLKSILDAPTTDDAYPTMKLTERARTAKILRENGTF
jgi:hypothetical protein